MAKKPTAESATRVESDADVHAFRSAMSGVRPLAHRAVPEGLDTPRKKRPRRAPTTQRRPSDDEGLVLAEAEVVSGSDALSFHRPGVRAQVMRRLRRGLYPIEDELDLHGLSQAEARANLSEFIAFNRDAGHRCVRIIHGKGYRSGARGPILKIAVNAWLKRHFDVMAFTSARAIDGGTGAVYVLLRG
jgi:DNA-nicking Smr family endonuclease